jgi:hypothetical protein
MANTSPWAQVAPDMSAPPPGVLAPVQLPDSNAMPQVFAPTPNAGGVDLHAGLAPIFPPSPKVVLDPNPQHQVEGAFANGNASEGMRLHDQNKLVKDYQKDADPYGSPDNHPGFFGKLAHALSHATGGDTRRGWEEQGLVKQINAQTADDAQNAYTGAKTGETEEATKEMPGKTQSEEGLQGAQTANLQSETTARNAGPDLATAYAHAVNQAIKNGADPSTDPVVQHLADSITAIQKTTPPKGSEHVDLVGPDGKPMAASYNPATEKYVDASGKEVQNPRPYEKPNQAGMVTMVVPDPNNPGGGVIERLGAGAKVAPGAQTVAGVNSMNTPTTNQRTAAGRAETVIAMAPEVLSRIDAVGSQMGPIAGRWNDFMQGKVGAPNEQFAALRSDLLMMSSAVALAHAQGRLPENLRQEFDHAINAPNQTPENLKATINTMIPWLQQVQSQGERPGAQPAAHTAAPAGPPAAGTVENGFRFKGGDPSKQENWVKQ